VTEKSISGIEFTPLSESFKEDPYPALAKLRELAPVFIDEELGRIVCTSHDDVKNLLRDKNFFTDPRKANPETFHQRFLNRDDGEPSMLMMDEPDHRRLRSLVSKPFSPAAVEKWRPSTQVIIKNVLAQIKVEEEGDFDLIAQYAGPVPVVVIAKMLGIDPSMNSQFKPWSDAAIAIAFNPFPTPQETVAGTAGFDRLTAFFDSEIERRKADLGDDLISNMIRAEEAGDKLTVTEIITQCILLLVAGNVTTTDLIGNCVKALLDHPMQLQKLRDNPSLINNAVEEALRFDSPVTNSGRVSDRDFQLGGCPVMKGESLGTSLAAANRDPAVYPQPDNFDIEREDTHHQSFGGGRHLCLGAHLARLEAQEAILSLLQKYPNLQHSDRGYQRAAVPGFRGMTFFWVKT
jgi:cytochrome P450